MTDPQPTPFFQTVASPGEVDARRRLLLISHHFPPSAAVGGVRWQQLSKYAAERGWGLDVICCDPAVMEIRDDSRLAQLPEGVRIYSAAAREPRIGRAVGRGWQLVRAIKAIGRTRQPAQRSANFAAQQVPRDVSVRALARAYFAWLDFARGEAWAKSAASVGVALARTNRYGAVVSSGPPHMAHEAARIVAEAAHLPLVLDFRDPWRDVERVSENIASPLWFRLAAKFEGRAVAAAELVVVNTDQSGDAMRRRYPAASSRILTVRNGSDEEPLPESTRDTRFTIRFAGSIYLDRDPRLVFRAAARVIRELQLTPRDLGILFIGFVRNVGAVPLEAMAAEEGVAEFVEARASLPREEALRFLGAGAMLLSLPQDAHMAIPAKIFEYARFPAWMLVLAEEMSATAQLLRATEADVVDPSDVDGITRAIRRRYAQFAAGERPQPVGHGGQFSRRAQADILFDRIDSIAASPASAARRSPTTR